MARKHKAVIDTPAGPRKCLQLAIERDRGRKPLVARFGGIPLRRVRTATLTDQRPVMASAKRNELIHRLLAGRCELCEDTEGLEVHHVRKLADLNKPGRREKPPGWNSWPSDGARPWSSAAAATRTSTLDGRPCPTRNDHWRAGCEETRKPCSGRDRRKRTWPRAPRGGPLHSMRRGLETEHPAMVTVVKRPAGETRGKVAAGPHAGQCHRASPRPYPVHRPSWPRPDGRDLRRYVAGDHRPAFTVTARLAHVIRYITPGTAEAAWQGGRPRSPPART